MSSPQTAYQNIVTSLAQQFRELISARAAEASATPNALQRAIIGELVGEEVLADGRAREWRVRMRLYDRRDHALEPVADTDDTLPAGSPGETVIRGLPQLIPWIGEMASSYHGAACAGLEDSALRRKIRNLRTMMACRKDGTGFLNADYEVSLNGRVQHMLARVDVLRADVAVEWFPARNRLAAGFHPSSS